MSKKTQKSQHNNNNNQDTIMQESINLTWTQKSTVPGVTSQNGDIGLSWLCNYSQTRHHWEDSRMWEWVWNARCNTETRADFMGRVRGMTTSQTQCPPPGHCSTRLRGLSWVYISSAGKRDTGVTIAPQLFCRSPYSGFALQGLCWASSIIIQILCRAQG